MEQEQGQTEYAPTAFDIETQSRNIQMLKTVIPYLKGARQRNCAVMVKCLELRNVIRLFREPPPSMSICSSESTDEMPLQLLNDIRKFCTPAEQDSIDMLVNAMQMFASCDGLGPSFG